MSHLRNLEREERPRRRKMMPEAHRRASCKCREEIAEGEGEYETRRAEMRCGMLSRAVPLHRPLFSLHLACDATEAARSIDALKKRIRAIEAYAIA